MKLTIKPMMLLALFFSIATCAFTQTTKTLSSLEIVGGLPTGNAIDINLIFNEDGTVDYWKTTRIASTSDIDCFYNVTRNEIEAGPNGDSWLECDDDIWHIPFEQTSSNRVPISGRYKMKCSCEGGSGNCYPEQGLDFDGNTYHECKPAEPTACNGKCDGSMTYCPPTGGCDSFATFSNLGILVNALEVNEIPQPE